MPRRKTNPKKASVGPTPPAYLSDAARAKWDQLVTELRDKEGWSDRDRHALYVLATSLAQYEQAQAKLDEQGLVVPSAKDPLVLVKNPYTTIQNQAWDRVEKLFRAFGMTPAGRHALKQADKRAPNIDELVGQDEGEDEG